MPNYGFGHRPFGLEPFGGVDWCKIVLWEELPDNIKEDDEDQGFPFRTFVFSQCPSFEWMRAHIRRFENLSNPFLIRKDLLAFLASNFGIITDTAEPEDFQRIRISLAARWNIIKGTNESYVVLARTHGFEMVVQPLWWDGTKFSTSEPIIANEASTFTRTTVGANTRYVIRLHCAPVAPSSETIRIGSITATDDGAEVITGVGVILGSIDYGWGYIDMTVAGGVSDSPTVSYKSLVGGNPETCGKIRTHRLRLVITPGTIAGQSELSITEAFSRLYGKLEAAKPIHVEFAYDEHTTDAPAVISLGHRFDVILADQVALDSGKRWGISLSPSI